MLVPEINDTNFMHLQDTIARVLVAFSTVLAINWVGSNEPSSHSPLFVHYLDVLDHYKHTAYTGLSDLYP